LAVRQKQKFGLNAQATKENMATIKKNTGKKKEGSQRRESFHNQLVLNNWTLAFFGGNWR
jgi:hypothetical protein